MSVLMCVMYNIVGVDYSNYAFGFAIRLTIEVYIWSKYMVRCVCESQLCGHIHYAFYWNVTVMTFIWNIYAYSTVRKRSKYDDLHLF